MASNYVYIKQRNFPTYLIEVQFNGPDMVKSIEGKDDKDDDDEGYNDLISVTILDTVWFWSNQVCHCTITFIHILLILQWLNQLEIHIG
jgi:hypothetical protein